MPDSLRIAGSELKWLAVHGAVGEQNTSHRVRRSGVAMGGLIQRDAGISGCSSSARVSVFLTTSVGEWNRCGWPALRVGGCDFDLLCKRALLCLLRFRLGGFLPKSPGVQRDVSAQVPGRRVGQFANYDLFSGDKL